MMDLSIAFDVLSQTILAAMLGASGWFSHASGSTLFSDGNSALFGVINWSLNFGDWASGTCPDSECPGSSYNVITAAYANIGYMTHGDFLYYINNSGFSAWGPLLYVVAGVGALIGIALNNPPKQWGWFFLGPALFQFLVGSQVDVRGVSWKVAGVPQPMSEVWRLAETGLANTAMAGREGISFNIGSILSFDIDLTGTPGNGQFRVAYPLVVLDSLLSSSADSMIQWIGIGRQEGAGGTDSNLFAKDERDQVGPWYLMSNLKWPMLENIVGVQARDPDVRDALVTFLASECGDQFKKGVDSGAYAAASQARGASVPMGVFLDSAVSDNFVGPSDFTYPRFVRGIDTEAIPTPRSVVKLFNQPVDRVGAFPKFSQVFSDYAADKSGRTSEIVCSEYLYTIIQALRWESGHAFWQLVRSAPNGFNRYSMLKSLFYGWDIREAPGAALVDGYGLERFVKQLIFLYMVRNELLFAPQVTEDAQRFAPADESRRHAETYIRQQGSRFKGAELYNWAVMMPHLQGIVTYLVLIGYPFAALLMILPGQWKAMYTWATFLAWVKLWDVGFAIVHTLERTVWAMIGNNSAMARVANRVLSASQQHWVNVGTDPSCSQDFTASFVPSLAQLCPIPDVAENAQISQESAWGLLDQTMTLIGSADLDLSNGYYIYIMSALYFAVPAVTGQLVLGAKAGLGGIATKGAESFGSDAAGGAKAATVGENSKRFQASGAAVDQAAKAKSFRQTGLALQHLDAGNRSMDASVEQAGYEGEKNGLAAAATAADLRAKSFASQGQVLKSGAALGGKLLGTHSGTGSSTGSSATGGFGSWAGGIAGAGGSLVLAGAQNELDQATLRAQANSQIRGVGLDWAARGAQLRGSGYGKYANQLQAEAEYAASMSAWDAKNEFAQHAAGTMGAMGVDGGTLAPGQKPDSMIGMAMVGQLGGRAEAAARYSNTGYLQGVNQTVRAGQKQWGSSYVNSFWGGGYDLMGTADGMDKYGDNPVNEENWNKAWEKAQKYFPAAQDQNGGESPPVTPAPASPSAQPEKK